MQKIVFTTCSMLLVVAIGVWGCEKNSTKGVNTATPSTTESHEKDVASGDAANADIVAALAKLLAEDRTIAEKQKVCPVSGEPLGAMGPPIKIDVKGQPVFICCEGCKDKLLAHSDEYLAKIKK